MVGTPFWSERFRGDNGSRPFIVHPALRLAVFLALVIVPLCIDSLTALLIIFAYLMWISIYSRVPPVFLRAAVRTIAPFILLILLLNILFTRSGDESLFSWYGLSRGIVYGLRILVVYAAVLACVATTSQEEMARAMAMLVAPFSETLASRFALFGFISFGFLPVFFEEYERIKIVQQFRGGGFRGGVLQRLDGARAILIPLLVSAVRRSAQLSMTVELRSVHRSIGVFLVKERPVLADYVRVVVTAGVVGSLLLFP